MNGGTWFVARRYGQRISAVEVDRFSEKSVWIKGKRHERLSRYESYYPTWQEAKDALITKAEASVYSARLQLERLNGELGNIKGLKP